MKRLLEGKSPVLLPSTHNATGRKSRLPWLKAQIQKDLEEFRKSRRSPSPDADRNEFSDSFVMESTADESPTKIDQPREPDMARSFRSSKIGQVRKTMAFQPYKSTRPDLLEVLNNMVEQGLKMISSKTPADPTTGKVEHDEEKLYLIYSTAFQVYVNESTLYQQFLTDVKNSYDGYIMAILNDLERHTAESSAIVGHENELQAKLSVFEAEKQAEIKKLTSSLREMEFRYAHLQQEKMAVDQELQALRESRASSRKEYDDLKGTCAMLTSSLSRMEEEFRRYQTQENARGMEISSLRSTEQKLNEEIDRLQLVLQNNETALGMMVPQEVVQGLEQNISIMKEEQRRMEATHRQLIMRYVALKSAVDSSFAKYEQNHPPISAEDQQQQTKEKVEDVLKDSLLHSPTKYKRKVDTIADPVDKVLFLIEKGLAAKLVVEALLDQITQRQLNDRSTAQTGPYIEFSSSSRDSHPIANYSPGEKPAGPTNFTFSYDADDGLVASEDFKSPWTHFDGLGYDDSVPSYLRFNGKIQNLALSKRDLLSVLQELWDAKSTYDAQLANIVDSNAAAANKLTDAIIESTAANSASFDPYDSKPMSAGNNSRVGTASPPPGSASRPRRRVSSNTVRAGGGALISQALMDAMPPNPSFPVFIEYYLRDKFRSPVLAIEMYYNIMDGLKRFAALSDVKLFMLIFEDKMPFEIKDDMQSVFEMVNEEVMRECKTAAGNLDGIALATRQPAGNSLPNDVFMRLMRRLFPFKPDQSFGKLSKVCL